MDRRTRVWGRRRCHVAAPAHSSSRSRRHCHVHQAWCRSTTACRIRAPRARASFGGIPWRRASASTAALMSSAGWKAAAMRWVILATARRASAPGSDRPSSSIGLARPLARPSAAVFMAAFQSRTVSGRAFSSQPIASLSLNSAAFWIPPRAAAMRGGERSASAPRWPPAGGCPAATADSPPGGHLRRGYTMMARPGLAGCRWPWAACRSRFLEIVVLVDRPAIDQVNAMRRVLRHRAVVE